MRDERVVKDYISGLSKWLLTETGSTRIEAGFQGLGMQYGHFEFVMSESHLRHVEQTTGYTGLELKRSLS